MQTEKIVTERTTSGDSTAKQVASQQYLHTHQAAATVPLLQSVITGLMLGLACFAILTGLRVRDAWIYGLVVWLLVQAVTWVLLNLHWLSLTNLEKLTGPDINRDGVIGAPGGQKSKAEPWSVRVTLRTVTDQGHYAGSRFLDLPGSPSAIVTLATALLGGASMAERFWMGDGKLFSPTDYRAIMRIFREEDLIELKNLRNERDGYKLSAKGTQTMTDIRDQYQERVSPPPSE